MSAVFDRAMRSFTKLDGKTDSLVKRMDTAGYQMKAALGMMGAGVAGLAGAFALASESGKFETSMTNLKVISGATAKEMQDFRAAVLGADQSMYTPKESADALREMAAAGFTAKEALGMLQPVLDLATASMGDLGISEAAGLASQAIKAFGKNASDTRVIVDEMIKSANLFALAPKDLPLAIGTAARGAQVLHQSFEETLIAVGLVKNVIPRIETAATAASVAMERMAGGSKLKHLKDLVDPIDKATGKFRPFLDIVGEMAPKLNAMSEAARSAKLIQIFGAEGMGGVQAIMTQLQTGITKTNGEIVKGGDAIAYLRGQLEGAKGAAAAVAQGQLQTFSGQIDVLKANFSGLLTVIGEPFGKALKPAVEALNSFIASLKDAFAQIPDDVKTGIAQVFLVGSAILAVVGSILAGQAAFAVVGTVISALGVTIGTVLVPLLAVGAAIAAVALLWEGFQANAASAGGGALGAFSEAIAGIKLAFQGLIQIFSDGGFSGQVREDLNKAENGGIKGFVIKVALWVERIRNFFRGMSEGFSTAISAAQPIFDTLVGVIKQIAAAFGVSVGPANDNISAWNSAAEIGNTVGQVFGIIASLLVGALTTGLQIARDAILLMMEVWDIVGPTVMAVGRVIHGVVQVVAGVFTGDWNTAWRGAAKIVTGVVDFIIGIVGGLLNVVFKVVDGIGRAFGKDLGLSAMLSRELGAATDALNKFADGAGANSIQQKIVQTYSMSPMPHGRMATFMPTDLQGGSVPIMLANERARARAIGAVSSGMAPLRDQYGIPMIRDEMPHPAAAQSAPSASGAADLAGILATLPDRIAAAQAKHPLVVHSAVHMDGEVVGRSLQRRKKDDWIQQ
jgi:TP901 family phage tail tape measure protein